MSNVQLAKDIYAAIGADGKLVGFQQYLDTAQLQKVFSAAT